MECVLSGNQIKSFNRAVNCLARIGNELLIQANPDELTLRTLNSSWSAFMAITFKRYFFDSFQISSPNTRCSVLLKAVCTVFRTPPGSIERLSISLPDEDATKLQWTLECLNGIRKTYWITCNNEDEFQNVSLDRNSIPSHLVVKPRDLNRLLAHFQSSLHEITMIATEPVSSPTGTETEAKAIELRSYIDPSKGTSDGTLHTQLCIDPAEELLEYSHTGVPVDVTFSLKEVKAFTAFCEGSEANMHIYFEKAGKPMLLAPRFGLDDAAHSDLDATLLLATMLSSQLHANESTAQVPRAGNSMGAAAHSNERGSHRLAHANSSGQRGNASGDSTTRSGQQSDGTVIWSELSGGSGGRTTGSRARPAPVDSGNASEEVVLQRHSTSNVPRGSQHGSDQGSPVAGGVFNGQGLHHHETANMEQTPGQHPGGRLPMRQDVPVKNLNGLGRCELRR